MCRAGSILPLQATAVRGTHVSSARPHSPPTPWGPGREPLATEPLKAEALPSYRGNPWYSRDNVPSFAFNLQTTCPTHTCPRLSSQAGFGAKSSYPGMCVLSALPFKIVPLLPSQQPSSRLLQEASGLVLQPLPHLTRLPPPLLCLQALLMGCGPL